MKGKLLLDSLSRIEEDEWGSIWSELPEIAGGTEWIDEIIGTAERVKGYLTEDGDYLEEVILDLDAEYADAQISTYYYDIHYAVNRLGLWASPTLDDEVEMLGFTPTLVFTETERNYYYAHSRIVWRVVVEQAFKFARGEEE